MSDKETLSVYAEKAQEYEQMTDRGGMIDPALRAFIDGIPKGGHVLDLGCGPGQAAETMAAHGLSVLATDAVPEMVALAQKAQGVTARVASFDDIEGEDLYDGVWANFSLLHASRTDMPRYLDAVCRALRPGGWFHIGTKLGTGEARDKIGRLYTYYEQDELEGLLDTRGLTITDRSFGDTVGLDGVMAKWICLRAHA
ncbi:MAG: class I SAM-dependent methyltransferase [Paracoccaceae bacterium]